MSKIPFKGTEFSDRPWSRIADNFFQHKGMCCLLVMDYYSRDIKIHKVTKNVTLNDMILKMDTCSCHGILDINNNCVLLCCTLIAWHVSLSP